MITRKALATVRRDVRRVIVAMVLGAMVFGVMTGFRAVAHAAEMPNCGNDNVVWLNARTRVFHYRGTPYFGTTKTGAYECEKAATDNGARAAKNETKPESKKLVACTTDSDCAAKNPAVTY